MAGQDEARQALQLLRETVDPDGTGAVESNELIDRIEDSLNAGLDEAVTQVMLEQTESLRDDWWRMFTQVRQAGELYQLGKQPAEHLVEKISVLLATTIAQQLLDKMRGEASE